jgi:hypothetical protein
MSEFIDPIVFDAVDGKTLPTGHRAKLFASCLPRWHPVRVLFYGSSQWLGQIDAVTSFLEIFSGVYADRINQASNEGLLEPSAEPPEYAAECEAFKQTFPNDVVCRLEGKRRAFKIHSMHRKAREMIITKTAGFPPVLTIGLADFDATFALLVRAVRWT